jgi:DNA N-6-adenine-methyltransferase (Dam)
MTELAAKRPRPPRKSKNAARLHAVVSDIAEMAPRIEPLALDLQDEDDRETPESLFGPLNDEFHFTLDVAASKHNAKCLRYCTVDGTFLGGVKVTTEHGLVYPWDGERVWCNPPFSDPRAWIERAWDESAYIVALLLPNNRDEQAFWQDLIEPYRDRVGSVLTTRNLRRRRPFISRVNGEPVLGKSPPFGLVLCIWDRIGLRPPRNGALNEQSTDS